jgi:uncharacterized protein YlxW (UPF0749 family)
MEELLKYHIRDTEKRFEELKDSVQSLEEKLDDVAKFKAEMLVSARWVSLIISAVCGAVTMVTTALVEYFISVKH